MHVPDAEGLARPRADQRNQRTLIPISSARWRVWLAFVMMMLKLSSPGCDAFAV